MKCSLCHQDSIDSMEVEAGNNAEYSVTLNLCEGHLKESEKLGYKFEEKYGLKIEELCYERFI